MLSYINELLNKPTSYLEVEEDIKDVKDLYFEITQFMDNIGNMDDAFPVCYGYERKLGYVMKVSEGCAIKWDGIIYCEGDVLGVVKDKEMI